MYLKKHISYCTGDQRQLPDDELALGDVPGGDEVPAEQRVLLHLHRPALVLVAAPVALLVLLTAVEDAPAAGALLQGRSTANGTCPAHFARSEKSVCSTKLLRCRLILAHGALSILGECVCVRRGLPLEA